MSGTYDLAAYRRHAERFGPECVFETAVSDLGVVDLGHLSLWVQRQDPGWRPPVADRAEFADELIAAGMGPDRACGMAMVSRSTLRRREKVARNGGKVADRPPNPQCSWAKNAPKRGTPTQPLPTPNLRVSAPQNGLERVAVIPGQMAMFEGEEAPVA